MNATESMLRELAHRAKWLNDFDEELDAYTPDPIYPSIERNEALTYYFAGFNPHDGARRYAEDHHIGINS